MVDGQHQHQRILGHAVTRSFGDIPALESIHELSGGVETFAHEGALLAHGDQGIFEEAGLILRRRGGRHVASLLLVALLRCVRVDVFGVVFDPTVVVFEVARKRGTIQALILC